jgi:leucine dehydrogenase
MEITQDETTLNAMSRGGHEFVQFSQDPASGLRSIIALHSTRLGPSIGGVRMRLYTREADALGDALRLSRGMTYKAAAAGIRFGGAKTVVIADSPREKTHELLKALAGVIDRLGGRYIAAEDVGTDERDIAFMRQFTPHTTDPEDDGAYYTALGAFHAIRACLRHVTGDDGVSGKRVAIQGLGRTGWELATIVGDHGGSLIVADLDSARTAEAAHALNARVVAPGEILEASCDVLAPCALGGVIGTETVPRLACSAIAGTANDVLADEGAAEHLRVRGIAMAPDYVANAGGIIKAAADLDGMDEKAAQTQTARVYETTLAVLVAGAVNGTTPQEEANGLAKRVLERPPAGAGFFFPTPLETLSR